MQSRLNTVTAFLCMLIHVTTQHGFKIDPGKDPENTLRRSDFIRDKEHLKEHMTDVDFDPDKVSPEELDFHFFKVHDLNEDNGLDGLELLQALRHSVEEQIQKSLSNGQGNAEMKSKPYLDSIYTHLTGIVDKILEDDDADKNGYINYSEFAHTRRASELLQQINAAK